MYIYIKSRKKKSGRGMYRILQEVSIKILRKSAIGILKWGCYIQSWYFKEGLLIFI